MGEGVLRPRLRGAHVQRPSPGPRVDHPPAEHHSACGPLVTSTGLETEGQKRQVVGAGSLSEAARRGTPTPARAFARGRGLPPASVAALREF